MILSTLSALLLAAPVAPAPSVPSPIFSDPAGVSGPAGAEAESVLQIYDLRPLVPRFDGESTWSHSLMFPPGVRPDEREALSPSDLYVDGEPEVIVDLLTQVLGDDLRYEGREISLNDNAHLLVLAPESVQVQVRNTLAALAAALGGTVELTVDVVEFDGAASELWPQKNVIPANAAELLINGAIGRGASHHEFRLSLSAGCTAAIDQMRRFPILFDYDVEIAQGSFVHDPIWADIEEGLRVFARGVPVGGGLALSLVFQAAEMIGDVQERPIVCRGAVGTEELKGVVMADGPSVVQAVDVFHRSVALNTFLPRGSALVLASQASLGGHERTQMVVIRQTGGALSSYSSHPLPGSTRTLVVANSEALNLPMLGTSEHSSEYYPESTHPLLTAELDAEPSLFLFDWVKYRFRVWRRLGPWAVMITDPSWDQGAAAELNLLLANWKPDTSVVDVDVKLIAQGASEQIPVRWSLPVRPGTECGLVCGISSQALWDYDVEVAQMSACVDPVIAQLFDGLLLSVRPFATASGRTLDARGLAQLKVLGPMGGFEPHYEYIGRVDQPVFDRLRIDEHRVLGGDGGETLVVGGRSQGAQRPTLRLEIGAK